MSELRVKKSFGPTVFMWTVCVLWLTFTSVAVAKDRIVPWYEFYWGINHLAHIDLANDHVEIPHDCSKDHLPEAVTVIVDISMNGEMLGITAVFDPEEIDLCEGVKDQLKLILLDSRIHSSTDKNGQPISSEVPISLVRDRDSYRIVTDFRKINRNYMYPEFKYWESRYVSPDHEYAIWYEGFEHWGRILVEHNGIEKELIGGLFRYPPKAVWHSSELVEFIIPVSTINSVHRYYIPRHDLLSQKYDCLLDCVPGAQLIAYVNHDSEGKHAIQFADFVTGRILFASQIPNVFMCGYDCGCCDISGQFLSTGQFEFRYDCSSFPDDNYPEKPEPDKGRILVALPAKLLLCLDGLEKQKQ